MRTDHTNDDLLDDAVTSGWGSCSRVVRNGSLGSGAQQGEQFIPAHLALIILDQETPGAGVGRHLFDALQSA